jgi:short-subunit dehydrogenase
MNTTLITGASSGIGEAFARNLAALNRDVLLVARSEDKLVTLCNELGRLNRIRAQYITLDLSLPEAPRQLFEEVEKRGLEIDLLINNAGFGAMGDFTKLNLERQLKMIDLNVKALVELTYRFLVPMRARGNGAIINVASTAGFQPVPYMASYAATKAFVLTFSEALWEENRLYGIKIMALCPGVTDTNFFEAAQTEKPPMRVMQSPEEVVEAALSGLEHGRSHIVSGWTNLLMIEAERLVPRSFVARMAGRMMRPRYGTDEQKAKGGGQ